MTTTNAMRWQHGQHQKRFQNVTHRSLPPLRMLQRDSGGAPLAAMLASGLQSSPPAGEPCFHLHLDWTAGVVEVAADFLADGVANLLGQRSQCLTGGASAAFKGAIKGIERR